MKFLQRCLFLVVCAAIAGCNKYLDVQPKGYVLLKTIDQYDQWLNQETLAQEGAGSYLPMLTDCVDNPVIQPGTKDITDLVYLWSPQFNFDITTDPPLWTTLYGQIYCFNTVLNGVDDATGGTVEQKRRLKAEALLGRANCYLELANLYGKVYDSTTAMNDLAVPFVTSNDVSKAVPGRSTIKQLYDQLIADINTALPDLPASNAGNRFRGSVAAAYSVLARTYLFARDYKDAATNAQLALSGDPSLKMLDYNQYGNTGADVLPNQGISPDAIYSRNSGGNTFTVEPTFIRSFNPADHRLRLFFSSVVSGLVMPYLDYNTASTQRGAALYTTWKGNSGNVTTLNRFLHNSGTTVAEMKLIIAEVAARNHDAAPALAALNEVRSYRFPSGIQPIVITDPDSLLQRVLLERKFELALNGGCRWWDMRRLDVENRMPAVTRYNAGSTVIATLPPHGPRYVLQIPDRVLTYNPGMSQNP